jgi:hypothetical protein
MLHHGWVQRHWLITRQHHTGSVGCILAYYVCGHLQYECNNDPVVATRWPGAATSSATTEAQQSAKHCLAQRVRDAVAQLGR